MVLTAEEEEDEKEEERGGGVVAECDFVDERERRTWNGVLSSEVLWTLEVLLSGGIVAGSGSLGRRRGTTEEEQSDCGFQCCQGLPFGSVARVTRERGRERARRETLTSICDLALMEV